MKALAFLGPLASIVTIVATLVRLRWHKIKEAPGPTPVQSGGQKALLVGAAVWLVLFGLAAILVVSVMVVPAIVELFV